MQPPLAFLPLRNFVPPCKRAASRRGRNKGLKRGEKGCPHPPRPRLAAQACGRVDLPQIAPLRGAQGAVSESTDSCWLEHIRVESGSREPSLESRWADVPPERRAGKSPLTRGVVPPSRVCKTRQKLRISGLFRLLPVSSRANRSCIVSGGAEGTGPPPNELHEFACRRPWPTSE